MPRLKSKTSVDSVADPLLFIANDPSFDRMPFEMDHVNLKDTIQCYLRSQNRDIEFINKFDGGYCSGISALGLYCLWLETQPIRLDKTGKQIPRDDWSWFQSTVKKFSEWQLKNGKNKKKKNIIPAVDIEHFERFIALIEAFQNTCSYEAIGQGELEKMIHDTRGNKLQREYSLAGLFMAKDFTKIIKIETIKNKNVSTTLFDELFKEKRLILVSSHNHDVGIFMYKENYILFDSNSGLETYESHKKAEVIERLFELNEFDKNFSSPFGFRCFTFDSELFVYADQQKLLKAINAPVAPHHKKYADYCTGLHMAAWIGCDQSMEYFLSKNADVNAACSDDGSTPTLFAALNGKEKMVKTLLVHGAEVDKKCSDDGSTPLHVAIENGHASTVKLLLTHHANTKIARKTDRVTPEMAAKESHYPEVMEVFREFKIAQSSIILSTKRKRKEEELELTKASEKVTPSKTPVKKSRITLNSSTKASETGASETKDQSLNYRDIKISQKSKEVKKKASPVNTGLFSNIDTDNIASRIITRRLRLQKS